MLKLRNPRIQLILLLSLLFLITMFHLEIGTSIMLLIFSVGGAALFDCLFAKIKKQELRIPYSGIITGLILALIIDPTASWWQILVIAAAATGIKDFLRIGDRHIFNPAASGLMVGFLLFGLNPSWWGPTPYGFGKLHPADLAVAVSVAAFGYVSLWRYKRYFNVVSFLVVSIILQIVLLATSPVNAIQALINPGSLFFALVMLPEPMTTPVKKLRQVLFGTFVAFFNIGAIYAMVNGLLPAFSNFPDTSLIALLLANLLFFKFR
jgi:Na+-translocating ferredoxin:NAD+ oxidoreductase RnfD subunit